jgi:hypothetical protein
MAAVRARHTFGHRVDEMLRVVGPALDARPTRVATESRVADREPAGAR